MEISACTLAVMLLFQQTTVWVFTQMGQPKRASLSLDQSVEKSIRPFLTLNEKFSLFHVNYYSILEPLRIIPYCCWNTFTLISKCPIAIGSVKAHISQHCSFISITVTSWQLQYHNCIKWSKWSVLRNINMLFFAKHHKYLDDVSRDSPHN